MTASTFRTAPLAAAAWLLLSGCAGPEMVPEAAVEQRTFDVAFAMPPPERIAVQLYRGHVLVSGGPAPVCSVLARVRGDSAAEAQARVASMRLEGGVEQGTRTIRVSHARGAPLDAVDVRYRIEVPAAIALAIRARSARVSLRRCSGAVEVETETGEIRARPSGGSYRLSTASGSIRLGGTFDQAVLATGTGDVEVLLHPEADDVVLDVRSDSGKVMIAVPDDCKLRLRHETETGRLRSDFPVRGDVDDERVMTALVGDPSSARTVRLTIKSRNSLVEVVRQAEGSKPPPGTATAGPR